LRLGQLGAGCLASNQVVGLFRDTAAHLGVQDFQIGRISEREVGYTDIQRLFAGKKEFYGSSLLGAGLLCKYCWIR
jgi:hypothetical protein